MAEWKFMKVKKESLGFILWRNGAIALGQFKDYDYSCLENIKIEHKVFDYGNKLGATAAISILTENIARFKKPSTWWDAVKERFFPNLAAAMGSPVEYDIINIKALYPNATYKNEKIIWKGGIESG